METTIILIIVNVLVSVFGSIDIISQVKKSALTYEMYKAQSGMLKTISYTGAALTRIFTYVSILGYLGETWMTIGWWLYWFDTVGMITIVILYRYFIKNWAC